MLAYNSIALSKLLRVEIDVWAFAHTGQHLIICSIQCFQRDYFLLDEEFDIYEVTVTSPRYLAQSETVEIKVKGID